MSVTNSNACTCLSGLTGLLIAISVSSTAMADVTSTLLGTDQNALLGVDDNLQTCLSVNSGSIGDGGQSLQVGAAFSTRVPSRKCSHVLPAKEKHNCAEC